MSHSSLPSRCILRPACAKDIWAIRKLVWQAKLDPTQLRWSQFWAIECDKRLVACGQLRSFSGARELGSLVVAPAWRGQGLGKYLVEHLVQEAKQPLYLECLGNKRAMFYSRFGFVSVDWRDLPKPLKLKFSFSALAATVFRVPIIIMRHQQC